MKSVIPLVLIGAGALGLVLLRITGMNKQAREVPEAIEPIPDESRGPVAEPDHVRDVEPAVVNAPLVATELAGETALVATTVHAAAGKAAKKAATSAAKAGAKVAATTGAKAIPVVGWGLAAVDMASRGWDGKSFSAANVVDSLKQDFDDLTTYGKMFADDPVETLRVTADAFGEMADDIVKTGQSAVHTAVASATEAVQTAASGAVEVFSSAASALKDLMHIDVPKVHIKLPKLW